VELEGHHEQRLLEVKGNVVNDILECLENDIPTFPCLGFGASLNFDMLIAN
jgi:hypothetical protein